MVNKKEIKRLCKLYDNTVDGPGWHESGWADKTITIPFIKALGNDKDEIIEYAKGIDENTKSMISTVIDELREKFNDEEFLDEIIDICFKNKIAK